MGNKYCEIWPYFLTDVRVCFQNNIFVYILWYESLSLLLSSPLLKDCVQAWSRRQTDLVSSSPRALSSMDVEDFPPPPPESRPPHTSPPSHPSRLLKIHTVSVSLFTRTPPPSLPNHFYEVWLLELFIFPQLKNSPLLVFVVQVHKVFVGVAGICWHDVI